MTTALLTRNKSAGKSNIRFIDPPLVFLSFITEAARAVNRL
jgi:hypothetical protein